MDTTKLSPGDAHYMAYVGPPAEYDLMGATQFQLLSALGLRANHRLLDFGCGSLRAGRLLISYLDAGCYYGVEPNKWLIEEAITQQIGKDILEIKQPSFDYNALNPGGSIQAPDGIAVGTGVLAGNLYVNTNYGLVYEISLPTGRATAIASGGSRGDFASADTNGTLYLTQTDRILRLIPPAGGGIGDVVSSIVCTRDDLTNPNTTPYTAFSIVSPQTGADSTQSGQFDANGLSGGGVVGGWMQRGGRLSVYRSLTSGGPCWMGSLLCFPGAGGRAIVR